VLQIVVAGKGTGVKQFMSKSIWRGRWAALAIASLAPVITFAQNCALCYTQVAASGSRVIQALRSGILILVFPPMLICIAITWMAYKKRNQFNDYDSADPGELDRPE
jgi:hypothetical protein